MDGTLTSAVPIGERAKHPWLDFATEISGSLLYIDSGAAEFVTTTLGAPFLLGLGAHNVCDLDRASSEDAYLAELSGQRVTRLVVATTQLLTQTHPLVLKAALAHPDMSSILILSSVSEHCHACQEDNELGVEVYTEYAAMLASDISDGREVGSGSAGGSAGGGGAAGHTVKVTVKQLPMMICTLEQQSFVLPARCAAATTARCGSAAAGFQPCETTGQEHGGQEDIPTSSSLSILCHSLAGLCSQLGYGQLADTYAVGPVSTQIGRELLSLPLPSPALPAQGSAGRPPHLAVLLVDRSLDCVTPTTHPEHLTDMLLDCCARGGPAAAAATTPAAKKKRSTAVAWRPTDVRIDMGHSFPLRPTIMDSSTSSGSSGDISSLSFGAEWRQPSDRAAGNRMDQLCVKKTKDSAALVRKWLKQCLAHEKLVPSQRSKAGPVTEAELNSLVDDLTANKDVGTRHRAAVLLGRAASRSVSESVSCRWDMLASLEKQLRGMLLQLGVGQGGPAIAAALKDALATAQSDKGQLLATDVLSCLPGLYSLTLDAAESVDRVPYHSLPYSPFSQQETADLRNAFMQGLQHQHHLAMQHTAGDGSGGGGGDARAVAAAAGLEVFLPGCLSSSTPTITAHEELQASLDALLYRCQYLATARCQLQEHRRVTVSDMFAEDVGCPAPLLKSLIRKVLQGDTPADLTHMTAESFGGLLSKGLGIAGGIAGGLAGRMAGGLLGAVAGSVRPKQVALREATTLLVFVVGGITMEEARQVREEADKHGDIQVVLAGTSLLTPQDICRQLAVPF